MSSVISASIKPSYYKRYETKLNTRRRTRSFLRVRSSVEPPVEPSVEPPIKPSIEPYAPKTRFAEVLNGRAAMQGVLWGSLNWMMTGENVIQQVEDPAYAIAATGVVTTLALASLFTAENFSTEKIGAFTPEAEIKNGRLAMLGFTTLLGLSAM
jgi:hypothetical protein|tara:strand:- start:1197 stop:1658 length:462 start_codon:yes stop_codon:yes gene_type:complete